jgi:hypothetical protein
MCNALRRDRLPDRRVVIRFDFTGLRHHERYWLLLEHGETEICKTYPGLDEDLYITAEAEAFVKWHAGQLTWAEALRGSRIRLDGPSWLIRAFPTWTPAACSPTSRRPARGDLDSRGAQLDSRPMAGTGVVTIAVAVVLIASGRRPDPVA